MSACHCWGQVAQRYLEHLLAEGRFQEAAALCPRLLKARSVKNLSLLQGSSMMLQVRWIEMLTMRASQGDATAWERWVYLFAQLRQLPVLATHLPTANPRLRQVPCLFVRATAP